MREFWVASGHHLTRRTDSGGMVVTPELLLAYLARPELVPPPEACDRERALHARLLDDPLRPVPGAELAALEDADARENWGHFLGFRALLLSTQTLEAAYLAIARDGAGSVPPIFLNQLCQLVLRNALDGCDDPFVLRAGELFFRPQRASVHQGALLLADAELVEEREALRAFEPHNTPLVALLEKPAPGDLDIMDDDNAWTYWSRSDAHSMAMNLGGSARARAGLCTALVRWIAHLLGVIVRIEPVAQIEDRDWRWFVGLDAEGTRIGNALWKGTGLAGSDMERVLSLMRLTFEDKRVVDTKVQGKPVYLILGSNAEKTIRMKPQNLAVGLPLRASHKLS
jgi:hypothetical protein